MRRLGRHSFTGPAIALTLAAVAIGGCGGGDPVAIPAPPLEDVGDDVRAAIEESLAGLRADPASADAWGTYGIVLDAHGFTVEAATCYRQATALEEREPGWHYLLGHLLILEDPAAALGPFERAIELAPDSPLFRHTYGDALLRVGRDDDALTAYEASITIDPDWRKGHLGIAEIALRRGDHERAGRALEHAERLAYRDREVHAKLARLYRQTGDDERAARETLLTLAYPDLAGVPDPYRRHLVAARRSAKACVDRGLQALERNDLDAAEREFRRAIELRPDSVQSRLNLGGVLTRLGRTSEALQLLEETVADAGEDPEAHNNVAVALMEMNRLDDARHHLDRALELDATHDGAIFNTGRLLERLGRPDEAAQAYRRALEINPVNAAAHAGLASVLAQRGQLDEALVHLREAADFDRGDARIAVQLAMASAALGRFDEAAAALRRALAERPRDADALAALATILATAPEARHRNGPEAVTIARRLVAIRADDAATLLVLAAAQAESLDFRAAVTTAERALALARARAETALAAQIESQLLLYRANRPYHQGPR